MVRAVAGGGRFGCLVGCFEQGKGVGLGDIAVGKDYFKLGRWVINVSITSWEEAGPQVGKGWLRHTWGCASRSWWMLKLGCRALPNGSELRARRARLGRRMMPLVMNVPSHVQLVGRRGQEFGDPNPLISVGRRCKMEGRRSSRRRRIVSRQSPMASYVFDKVSLSLPNRAPPAAIMSCYGAC